MLNSDAFNKLVDEIMSKGVDEDTAARFAALIGDTPIADKDGNILVIEGGKVLARLSIGGFFKK